MDRHSSVKARHVEYADMASIAAIAQFLDRQVKAESRAFGLDQQEAVGVVARKFKAGASTIVNILRCKNGARRVKSVCFSLGSRIIQAAIADIERQQQALEEERARLLDLAVHADPAALAQVEEGLAIVRQGLERIRGRA